MRFTHSSPVSPLPIQTRRSRPPAAVLIALLATLYLQAGPASAQPSETGKWSGTSNSVLSSNASLTATGIHMAWLRGDPDWTPGSTTKWHSYVFWWNNRTDFCVDPSDPPNSNPRFKGALYGWRPGGNLDMSGDMMSCGFTRLQLDDVDLDPGGDAGGHDIFCAGNSVTGDGRLLIAGGAEAEGSGSYRSAIFDPHVTSGSRWTRLGGVQIPRWYPTVVQSTKNAFYTYAGTQHPRAQLLFGKAAGGGRLSAWVGRHAISSSGAWDGDALPDEDTGASPSGNPDGTRPFPRYYAAGGAYRLRNAQGNALPITRTVLFGGRDSTGGWGNAGGQGVRNDVWWLEHNAENGADELKWIRFNTYSGDANAKPSLGLWKHSAIVNENTAELWAFGGVDGAGILSGAIFHGRVKGSLQNRDWEWFRYDLSGGPGARQLASAAYDEQYNRMIVYGGYTDTSGTVVTSDNTVYALDLDQTPPVWTALALEGPGSDAPTAPLAEAAMVAGPDDTEHLPSGIRANMYLYGGTSGGSSPTAVKSDVWFMYFPDETHVRWEKLKVSTAGSVAAHEVPGPRRGATAIRDHNSWNLRVYGGFGPDGAATDGYFYRIDIYRAGNGAACDTAQRSWVPQFAPEYHDGGRAGALVVFDPYEVSATTVETRTASTPDNDPWIEYTSPSRFEDFYPLLFPLPDGSFLDATAREAGRATYRFVPPISTPYINTPAHWEQLPSGYITPYGNPLLDLNGGSGVMRRLVDGTYDIMKCGLKDTEGSTANGLTARLRLTSGGTQFAGEGWTAAGTMHPRVFHNLVTLPNGKVLVTGGSEKNDQQLLKDTGFAVRRPQIWDPAGSGSWSTDGVLADEGLFRGYHATALVMPDGRAVTGGGNDNGAGTPDKHKFRVFAPPQWFNSSGSQSMAVTMLNLPDRVGYGATVRVDVSAESQVEKVVLLRPGAVTHGFNSSQMYAELTFSFCGGENPGRLDVTTPPTDAIPPGDYMMFVVAGGHWSIGRWLRLERDATTHYAGTAPEACPEQNGCIPTPEDPFCTGGDGGGGFYEGGTSVRRDPGAFSVRPGESISPTWVTNTLFAGVADGDVADDRLRLQPGPLQDGAVSRVRLSHRGSGSDAYSSVRLVAVDHADGEEALATQTGIIVGTRGTLSSVRDASGADVSAALASTEGVSLSLGEVIEVALPASSAGDGALWLATSGHPSNDGGIRIEEQTAAGWREVAVHTPRARRDMQVVSGLTSNTIRLVALGQHRLHGIGKFTPGSSPTSTVLTAAAVRHSGTGEVAVADPFTLTDGDSAWVDFVTPEPPAIGAREWFLEVTGTPQGYQPSAGALHARHAPAEEPGNGIARFRLAGGIPNPFNASTRVLFELPRPQTVRLEVFDMQGRLIRRLEQRFEAGVQSLVWDRRMTGGSMAPRGVYPIRVMAGDERANGRLTVR